jgi:hypothetical protein
VKDLARLHIILSIDDISHAAGIKSFPHYGFLFEPVEDKSKNMDLLLQSL